jgi:D-alanine--poly(phosphoribitol) ligase subunit 1
MAQRPLSLWAAFEQVASERAAAPALLFSDETISFTDLAADARHASGWLAAHGVRRGDIVALQLPKRRETYALWLGALRLGAPYVFVDPANPPSRTARVLERVRPKLLVTLAEDQNPFGSTERLDAKEKGTEWLASLKGEVPAAAVLNGLDPAYVMFTSGSTGEPKGAVIPQQGVLSLRDWARSLVGDPTRERFSNINPLHFDNSVFDLYGGLMNGAALTPVETYGASPNPARWAKRLREAETSVFFAVPTLFLTFDQLNLLTPETLPTARMFVFGGEGFPLGPLRAFRERFARRAKLINVYGPTETSCICSSIEITPSEIEGITSGFASLGRMHADFDHAVLDEDGKPVAPGDPGELWIGGPNVGLGYFANPEETAKRFQQDPRQSAYRSIWYRSGDLVREDADGRLWFSGRADNQVKIRGHRIELEEIDLVIERIPGVSRGVTVAVAGPEGPELRALFVASRQVPDAEVRSACEALPRYMRPAEVRQVDSLPKNANGKVDRKAVKAMYEVGG